MCFYPGDFQSKTRTEDTMERAMSYIAWSINESLSSLFPFTSICKHFMTEHTKLYNDLPIDYFNNQWISHCTSEFVFSNKLKSND